MLYRTSNPHGGDIYGRPIDLDYSANTNPLGTPPGVLEAMAASLSQVDRYPDPYCRKLVSAIADFEQLPPSKILCGNGAAELIYSYCEAVRPKRAVELAPTFSEYALGLERMGCTVERYGLHQEREFRLDEGFLPFLAERKPEAVFLCNPNNPTGQLIDPDLLRKILDFCQREGTRLFVDECFLDLTDGGESLKGELDAHPELLILRAFTKSYGMAGVRLGYCLCCDEELLSAMSRTVQPWNISVPAQAAGAAALREQAFLEKSKALIRRERPWMKAALEDCGLWVCPGRANYLLFRGPEDLHSRLLERRIAIRSCSNYHGLSEGWYRLAVRRHEENEILMHAIREICREETAWQKT